MSDLIVELERIAIEYPLLSILRAEFEAAGMRSGRLAVGDVAADPSMVYFLWHESGEVPVSMLLERESFTDEMKTRAAARAFIAKWKKRLP